MNLDIEITTRCRLNCLKCGRTKYGHLIGIKDLSFDQIKKIIDSKLYTNITFCGSYGDPIYHPDFLKVIEYTKKAGINVVIKTNGSGKTKEWWLHLFNFLTSKDTIFFAIDGYKETVGKYRINFTEKDFDQVLEIMNISKNVFNINTVWAFIPFNFNEKQIYEAAKLALKYNITFAIKKSDRWIDKNDPLMPQNKKLISQSAYKRLFT